MWRRESGRRTERAGTTAIMGELPNRVEKKESQPLNRSLRRSPWYPREPLASFISNRMWRVHSQRSQTLTGDTSKSFRRFLWIWGFTSHMLSKNSISSLKSTRFGKLNWPLPGPSPSFSQAVLKLRRIKISRSRMSSRNSIWRRTCQLKTTRTSLKRRSGELTITLYRESYKIIQTLDKYDVRKHCSRRKISAEPDEEQDCIRPP